MPNLIDALKKEITRLARKETKGQTTALRAAPGAEELFKLAHALDARGCDLDKIMEGISMWLPPWRGLELPAT